MPFFDESEFKRAPSVPRCNVCGVYRGCRTPKMPVTGEGKRKVLIVAEAPGREEDKRGTQLIGESGRLLREVLREIDVDLDRDCWKTNSVVCWPGEGNPKPTKKRIHREFNSWVCPTFHPAYLLRSGGDQALRLWFKRHLEVAFRQKGRPWEVVPDYRKQVRIEYDPRGAAALLESFPDNPDDPIAFDYETTMLKPDSSEAKIVSCAVAWWSSNDEDVRAVSFLWRGEAVEAMGELLRSDVPKIAANLKFEERWTRKEFGHRVDNWVWDTMQAAHVLDNRPGITGLKFQAYVNFGQPVYDVKTAPYFKSESNKPNRIYEIDPKELLLYGGLDALLEFKLAKVQMRKLGMERNTL